MYLLLLTSSCSLGNAYAQLNEQNLGKANNSLGKKVILQIFNRREEILLVKPSL
jgi:hypothetical protein